MLLLGIAFAGLWLARVPIASSYIDRTFAAKHLPARYKIADLGFGRQRLTNVVIGDPASPDLVADWIETSTDIGMSGPAVTGVRVGRVRVRGALVEGRVSLGALDRLLPAPSGKPFALPAIDLAVDDGRMRLTTPVGVVGLRLRGRGRLDDGFRGALAAVGERLVLGSCVVARPTAFVELAVRDAAPRVAGPVRFAAVDCAGTRVSRPEARVDVALSPALDRWRGSAGVRTGAVDAGGVALEALTGQIGFNGTAARTEGDAQLRGVAVRGGGARGGMVAFAGDWRVAAGRAFASGRVDARDVAYPVRLGVDASGTPVGPLVAALKDAAARAGARFDVGGDVAIGNASGRLLATVRALSAQSASGAKVVFGDGAGIVIGEPGGMRADGVLTFGGGGLPSGRVTLAQAKAGGPVNGVATLSPYAAGGARVALAPARFVFGANGALRLVSAVELSGPLGDGAIEGVRVPLEVQRDARGTLVINRACAGVRFASLKVAGLALGETVTRLCPVDGAMFRLASGGVGGGVKIAAPRLAGALGGTPLTLQADEAVWRHREAGFVLSNVATRIGRAEAVTRLDLGRLEGRVAGRAVSGTFSGGAGQIGNVPLLLFDAAGPWSFAKGALSLTGALGVADAAPDPRFKPLAAREVSLTLVNGAVAAKGTLFEPAKSVKVADVSINHALASGSGSAGLVVPGITFGDGFQPEELTRLTFGVIADVKGTIRGRGDIAWSPEGVRSTGYFGTAGTDLAAAFGPVTGIKGEVQFTDLLALESAPNQIATVASINPGVAVNDGRIDYQLLRDLRVKVNEGRWPFAGGTLTLRPTLLDFTEAQVRHMTFNVKGMEARQFLQQFDFKNLDATGVFDGDLPMVFDQSGGRIENGRLTVREGGGSLAYLGELTEKDLGTWGNIAFQALRSLRYRNLELVMNGPLAGEMITEVRFAGVSQGEGAKSNFLVRRLQQLPFVFNIRIKAPFRGLIDSAASFYDPKRLIQRNLPTLLEEQNKRADPPVIQPPASETMR